MHYFFTKNFHLIHFPPLLLVNACFIIGIINESLLSLFFMLFLVCTAHACYIYHTKKYFPVIFIVYSFFMLTGAWLHKKEWQDYNQFYTTIDNQKIKITGTIIDIYESIIHHKKKTSITLVADMIATNNHTLKSNKIFILHIKNNKCLEVGDTVTFDNVLCKKPSSKDFQRYQIKEQILATIFDENVAYHKDNHPTWSLRNWIWNHKNRLLQSMQRTLSPDCFRLFSSLFLGNRSCIKKELADTNEQFKTWGISHFLARSGLHLVLFVFMWQGLFSVVPIPLIIKQIIIIIMSFIYFVLTWTSTPFTRSFLLFFINKICILNKIDFHLLHYLTIVCFLFLVHCPLYLFFLDFQLSFALTFALAWLNQISLKQKNTLDKVLILSPFIS